MGAFTPQSRGNRNNPARQRLIVIGLAVFLLIDIGLVAFALTATHPPASAGTVAAAPTSTPSPAEPVEASPPVEVPPAETTATATVVPTRILAALDDSTAWRATTGGCPATSADPELTTDSGSTWEGFNASDETGASAILAINVANADTMSLVTLDDTDCAPQLVTTFVAGDAWKAYPDRVAAEWYINPATPGTVHTPGGDVAAPCAAVSAIAATDNAAAAVLCLDASVVTTLDSGTTWSEPAVVPGAAALAATTEGYAVAVANPAGCTGVSLVSVSQEGTLVPTADTACLPATVNPGETAISVAADSTVWLWAGDAFGRSTDGGLSWV